MSELEELFDNLRRGPWHADPNEVPQQGAMGTGNIESQGWLADGSVSADVIQANAVTAEKITAGAITASKIAAGAITATSISAGSITADKIATSAVTADKIAANAVTADKIAANSVTAAKIAAGSITANELAANSVTTSKIAANAVTANEIAANAVTASEIAADSITASEIATNAITTSHIGAGEVTSSRIELTISGKNFGANDGLSTAPGVFFDNNSTMGLYRSGNTVGVSAALGFGIQAGPSVGGVRFFGSALPSADSSGSVGSSTRRWASVWAVDGSINTSDRNEKKDIADSPLGLEFIRRLRPRAYRWRETQDTQALESVQVDEAALARELAPYEAEIEAARASSDSDRRVEARVALLRSRIQRITERHSAPARDAEMRRRPGRRVHYGLIAQEVKEALDAEGVDAAFWKNPPDGRQAIAYSELIAPLIKAVQELAGRVEALEGN